MSPVTPAGIVKDAGPSTVRFNFVSSPAASTSVRAVRAITPPSSTPKLSAVDGDLGSDVKCNSVPLAKVKVPAPVPSDKDVTLVSEPKCTTSTEESSSSTIIVADSRFSSMYPPS